MIMYAGFSGSSDALNLNSHYSHYFVVRGVQMLSKENCRADGYEYAVFEVLAEHRTSVQRKPLSVKISTRRIPGAVPMEHVSKDKIKDPVNKKLSHAVQRVRAQELCKSRGGRPGLPSLISLRFLWT